MYHFNVDIINCLLLSLQYLTRKKQQQVDGVFWISQCDLSWMTFCYLGSSSVSVYNNNVLSTALVDLRLK